MDDDLDLVGLTDGWDDEQFVELAEGWSEEARIHALEERRLRAHEKGLLNKATREGDKRVGSGQVPSTFVHPHSGHLMGKSEVGDTFEMLFARHGSQLLEQKYGGAYKAVSHHERGPRNTPLDFQIDATHGGELKTLNVNAGSQKTAMAAESIVRKEAAAHEAGLQPLLVVQVVDMEAGHVRVFAYPQFASKSVSKMQLLGSYEFTDADLVQAGQLAGYDTVKLSAGVESLLGLVSGWSDEARLHALEERRLHEKEHIPSGRYHVQSGSRVGRAHVHVYEDQTGTYVNSRGEHRPLTAAQVRSHHERGFQHRLGDARPEHELAAADHAHETKVKTAETAHEVAKRSVPPKPKRAAPPVLTGRELWQSPEGELADVDPRARRQAMKIWYHDNPTNHVLRGTYKPLASHVPDPSKSPEEQARTQARIDAERAELVRKVTADVERNSPVFTGLIHSSPAFTRSAVTYRGIKKPELLFGEVGSKVGKTVEDKGYQSLSATKEKSEIWGYGAGGAQVTVHLPAGTHALKDIAKRGGREDWGEYTLPPGTQMRVLSDKLVDVKEWGKLPGEDRYAPNHDITVKKRQVEVEVVPESTGPPVSPAPGPSEFSSESAQHLTDMVTSPSTKAVDGIEHDVREALASVEPPSGVELHHVAVSAERPSASYPRGKVTVSIRGRVQGASSSSVSVKRTISPLEGGGFHVEHDHMYLDPALQGKGLGSAINRAMEGYYQKVGAKTIGVQATSNSSREEQKLRMNGAYTWARAGFDWMPTKELANSVAVDHMLNDVSEQAANARDKATVDKAREMYQQVKANPRDSKLWPTPVEIAMLGYKSGVKTWPGKDVMANTDLFWYGQRSVLSAAEVRAGGGK